MSEKKPKAVWHPERKATGAGKPPDGHYAYKKPHAIHEYYDLDGDLAGLVYDFTRSSGEQIGIAATWCYAYVPADPDDLKTSRKEYKWCWKPFPVDRPLFRLREIAGQPDARVIVTVDEYSANVLQQLEMYFFGEPYVATTWAGGIKHIGETDWSPLRGRDVTVFLPAGSERYKVHGTDPMSGLIKPLKLQPWFLAQVKLAEILRRIDAKAQFILHKPGAKADGWCLREARADKMDGEAIRDMLMQDGRTLSSGMVDFIAEMVEGAPPKSISTALQASAEPAADTEWAKRLIRDREDDSIYPELANVRLVLSAHEHWQGVICEDVFAHRIMKMRAPPFDGGEIGEWSDADDVDAHIWLTERMRIMRVKTTDVTKAVLSIAARNGFNPLTDFLTECEALWKKDKKPRLDTWTQTYLGAGPELTGEETQAGLEKADKFNRYCSLVGKVCLLGAAKRAFFPGCQFDYVLILEGEQGKGKSSAIAILGGEFATDTPFDFHGKEGLEGLMGKWFVEMAELATFSNTTNETAKSFLPRRFDRFRLPYAKRSRDFPRANIFMGSTNEGEYFKDHTGARRYHPIKCRQVDREELQRDRMLLLGEAVVRMKKGEQVYPTPQEEDELVKPEQDKRNVPDPWIGILREWLAIKNGEVTMEMILLDGIKLDAGKVDESRMAMRVGRAMPKLGWEKIEVRAGAGRFVYRKKGQAE